jgi:hypothetical protein
VDDRMNAKIGEYCALVHGGGDLPGVSEAYALFRGLKRPLNTERVDKAVCVFVTKPSRTYTYPDRFGERQERKAPLDSVFVTYAEIAADPATVFASTLVPGSVPEGVRGVVIGWEWTLADKADASLPADHAARYVERVW